MSTSKHPSCQEEIKSISDQAAEWYTLFEGGARAQERAAFTKWIMESPLHLRAFLNVTAVDRLLEAADPDRHIEIQDILSHDHAENVVPLYAQRSASADWTPAAGAIGRLHRAAPIIGTALALLVMATGLAWYFGARPQYATGIGEQRSIALQDGSIVQLNAKSRLAVHFRPDMRELRLLEGEALFKVQRDPTRPFRVLIDGSVVQAIGTQFDVARRSAGATVSVLEGAVQISNNSLGGPKLIASIPTAPVAASIKLGAGESASLAVDGKLQWHGQANLSQVTAWRQRQLVFDESTLADIAGEFNRYNSKPQIRVEGDALRARRYAAVFDADDPNALLQFLRKDPALVLETRGPEIIVRMRPAGQPAQ